MRFSRLLQVASLSVSLLGVFAYLTCIGTPMAQAQADLGSVSGTVTDASGAVVPNASITLTNIANGAQRVSTTNAQGDYAITQLPPTEYRITVSAAGFTSSHQNFTLAIGATRTIHVRLNVSGGQTEIVVSTENTTTPDVADAQISTQITTSQVENMPLQDRNPYNLVNLSGNVSGQITGGDRGVGVDIGGARSASVDILMDGAENTDLFGVGVGQSIPQDAMQEFSVVIAGQGAEFGRASGGAVNVGTKSGTNQFHGDAYEYNRISTFASDSFQNNAYWAAPDHSGLTSPKPRYVHNQFGYFVGGPIKKNKLFFSSATEWMRIRSSLFTHCRSSAAWADLDVHFEHAGLLQRVRHSAVPGEQRDLHWCADSKAGALGLRYHHYRQESDGGDRRELRGRRSCRRSDLHHSAIRYCDLPGSR